LSLQTKILKKDRFRKFLEGLVQERVVYAPVRKGGVGFVDRIQAPDEVVLDYRNTKESPKSALFPQKETLFRYRSGKGKVELEVAHGDERGQVLFGVRPCDARGLLLLDKVFSNGCSDPYYADKRAGTLVVSLGCEAPNPTCFCLSTGGGPCSPEGSDVLFIDLGDRFAVEAATERGAAFLEDRAFDEGDEESLALARQVKERAEASMKDVAAVKPVEANANLFFNEPLWNDLAESCLGCGVCTYLCPTCHCFDLCDEGAGTTGERIRIWDSCQFSLFTQQASGFNPRATGKDRFRQRIMHKFSYLPETQSMLGCVGCGRCVTECPVNLDIREVITILSGECGR